MTDLNLLNLAARRVLGSMEGRLPLSLPPGDFFALLPPGPLREAARGSPQRLALLLGQRGVAARLSGESFEFRAQEAGTRYPAERATYHFWCLHQRLRQLGAPARVMRSLQAHLWDLTQLAQSPDPAALLSHVLLCWDWAEIQRSLQHRMIVHAAGDLPGYLWWCMQILDPEAYSVVNQDAMSLTQAISDAAGWECIPQILPAGESELIPIFPGSVNSRGLEARNLERAFRRGGMPLPTPLHWNDPEASSPALGQLRALPGLGHVATQLEVLVLHARHQALRRRQGLVAVTASLHMVFSGNPGTGKTTAARLLARALVEEGVLTGGAVIEVARAELIGQYVGHTAPAVLSAMDRAEGGVLLIDEAHGLLNDAEDPFGLEAIDTLVRGMENRRDRLVVILCGYPAGMERLMDANPGLRSRVARTVQFPDYSASQLLEILVSLCEQHDYSLDGRTLRLVGEMLRERLLREAGAAGNARMVRGVFEEAVQRQAARLARWDARLLPADLSRLTAADFSEGTAPGPLQA